MNPRTEAGRALLRDVQPWQIQHGFLLSRILAIEEELIERAMRALPLAVKQEGVTLEVEKLALAMMNTMPDILDWEMHADTIAAEYARLSDPDTHPPAEAACSCQGFPGSGDPHREWCTEPREQAYAAERAEFRRKHP